MIPQFSRLLRRYIWIKVSGWDTLAAFWKSVTCHTKSSLIFEVATICRRPICSVSLSFFSNSHLFENPLRKGGGFVGTQTRRLTWRLRRPTSPRLDGLIFHSRCSQRIQCEYGWKKCGRWRCCRVICHWRRNMTTAPADSVCTVLTLVSTVMEHYFWITIIFFKKF